MGIARKACVALALLWPLGSDAPAAGLNARDKADIRRAEAHLNSIRTLSAQFIQTVSTGSFAEGRLFLRRPGLLRLDYRPPVKLQIFADGVWLVYIDTELEELNQVPLSETPAGILVDETVRLSGAVMVTHIERASHSLRIHVVMTEEPDVSTLILAFQDKPIRLNHWIVVDSQGVRTRVALVNPAFNVAIDNKVFEFTRPDPRAFDP